MEEKYITIRSSQEEKNEIEQILNEFIPIKWQEYDQRHYVKNCFRRFKADGTFQIPEDAKVFHLYGYKFIPMENAESFTDQLFVRGYFEF